MYASKTGKVIGHAIAWLLFFSLIVSFVSFSSPAKSVFPKLFTFRYLLFFSLHLGLFYLNAYLLFPRLYLRKKYLYYFGVSVLLLIAIFFLKPFDRLVSQMHPPVGQVQGPPPFRPGMPAEPGFRPPQRRQHFDIVSIILFILIWSVSSVLQIAKQWRDTEQRAIQAEADRANAELSFLKAQIHPHFLFNTLNNIYSMVVIKSEHTAAAILKLSNIMRYVTDEVKQDYVPLRKEAAYISDYIDLQRLRLSNKVQLHFSVEGSFEGRQIAPLILMTFVENVFKYGISSHEPSVITIRLAGKENEIFFFCQNKIFESQINSQSQSTGIGISNTKKRLEHLYPDKHLLTINNEGGLFTVQLTLQA